MLRFLANRWTFLAVVILIAGVGVGTAALGEHASSQGHSRIDMVDGQKVLRAPGLDAWNDKRQSPSNNPGSGSLFGAAFHYDAFVYDETASSPKVAGVIRRGTALKLGNKVAGPGCKDGTWYKAVPFGYVCSSLGFHVSDDANAKSYGVPPAKVTNHLPYQYARVTTKRAPRYYRLPTVEEERQARLAMEKKGATPEVVSSLMEGDYFLALAEKETRESDGAVFYRTVRGRYVRVSDVELRNPDPVRGEELGRGGWRLPLAFVWGEDRELLSLNGDAPRVTGKAEKHARFVVEEELRKDGETFVVGEARFASLGKRQRPAAFQRTQSGFTSTSPSRRSSPTKVRSRCTRPSSRVARRATSPRPGFSRSSRNTFRRR
jgi:hypothetical protein